MSELVRKLSQARQRVALSRYESPMEFKNRLDHGLVLIAFPETNGTTELGVRLDPDSVELQNADFVSGSGSVRLRGRLELDFVPIQCEVEVDLSTMTGLGCVALLDEAPPA